MATTKSPAPIWKNRHSPFDALPSSLSYLSMQSCEMPSSSSRDVPQTSCYRSRKIAHRDRGCTVALKGLAFPDTTLPSKPEKHADRRQIPLAAAFAPLISKNLLDQPRTRYRRFGPANFVA